jgi:hypothetical protein
MTSVLEDECSTITHRFCQTYRRYVLLNKETPLKITKYLYLTSSYNNHNYHLDFQKIIDTSEQKTDSFDN